MGPGLEGIVMSCLLCNHCNYGFLTSCFKLIHINQNNTNKHMFLNPIAMRGMDDVGAQSLIRTVNN